MGRLFLYCAVNLLVAEFLSGYAAAQVCGSAGCGRQPTVEACVACSRPHNPGFWTEDGMRKHCQKVVRECHKAMKRAK
jgi:hypothetical protein